MYYHASKIGDLAVLKPFVSNHKKKYIYFSDKRENVLIYCSNPIEKYCKENKIDFGEKYTWLAPYGFDRNGTFCYEEYCPNLLYESYYGTSGYIYSTKSDLGMKPLKDIRNVYINENEVKPDKVEYIENVYDEIIKAEKDGKIKIFRYEDISEERKAKNNKMILDYYLNECKSKSEKYYYENHFECLEKYRKGIE